LLVNWKHLVMAALTILRAYHMAGRPRQKVRPWGGFDQWSREIREPLLWLGLADPCATREGIIVNDPDREVTAEVLHAWHTAFADHVMLVREVMAAARNDQHGELKQALLMVAATRDDSNQIDARRLGTWCSSKAACIIDGLSLTRDRKIRRAQGWRVSCVSSVSPQAADQKGDDEVPSRTSNDDDRESMRASVPFERPGLDSPDSPNSPTDPDEGLEV
jgi:hypothetical protein